MVDKGESCSQTKKHYDRMSAIYDPLTLLFYGHAQRAAVGCLQLEPGQVVLDIGCGTGLNFGYVLREVTDSGRIIGVEYSPRMIARAAERVRRHDWEGSVHLCQCDARELSRERLADFLSDDQEVDRVLFSLVLSVLPDWEQVFHRVFDVLPSGGRCTILGQYFSNPGPMARLIGAIASADISRHVWEPLKRVAKDYEEKDVARRRNFGSRLIVASGVKP